MQYTRIILLGGMGLVLWLLISGRVSASTSANTPHDEPLIRPADTAPTAERSSPEAAESMPPDRPRRAASREREDHPEHAGRDHRSGSPPGHEGQGERPPPLLGELSPEQIQAVLDILQEQNPQLARRLREALDKQPEVARRLLANQWPRLQRLIDLKRNNPRMFRLTLQEFRQQREMLDTARQLRQCTDPQKQMELRGQLRDQVQKLFDLRLEIKQRELELLETRVEEMRDSLEQIRQQREARIDKHLEALQSTKHPLRPALPDEEP